MSTNALIGLLKSDGRVISIYSHSDGYPEYLGALLNEHYLNINKVKKLMQKGDVSILGRNLEPCEAVRRFGFDGLFSKEARNLPQDEYNRLRNDYLSSDYSRFYTRDRGEYTPAKVYNSLDGWLEQRFQYQYLYYQGVWYVYEHGEPIDILTGEPVSEHDIPNFTKSSHLKLR